MSRTKSIAGTNLEQARSHNRRVVIEAVRINGALSRAAIARLTALTSQTVSNIVEELEKAELLKPAPTQKGSRGQPAVPYSINPDGGYSIGLQLDHQVLVGVVTDLSGTVRSRVEKRVDRPTPVEAMPVLASMPTNLMRHFRFDRSRLLGIGMSMPGPFGVDGLTSVGPTALPGWQDFPLASELQRLTEIDVTVENDATAAAIGERLYGVARNLNNFVYLFIGTGTGAGLLLDGHLYKGSRHNAGEIGHMVVQPRGPNCWCGKRGCLERYVSLRAAYEALALPDPDHASPELLEELLQRGDRRIEAWITDAAEALRQAINMLELTLDPETVVLGGSMPSSIIARLAAQLEPLPLSVSTRGERTVPRVMIGAAGKDTSVLGAAALPIFGETNPQFDVLQKPLG
jgi:predicted NBD/HSP70 family sugar kinase